MENTFKLDILSSDLLSAYKSNFSETLIEAIAELEKIETPVDYFQFYNSVSSVYSSKIEGEDVDFDSYFKHKFMRIPYKPDYTKKADDLYSAYEFIAKNKLSLKNLKSAHAILSSHLLPKSQQGRIRKNPMYVINSEDRIEYIAAEPLKVEFELERFFSDIDFLQRSSLNVYEALYFAAYIHLVFVKIHPFQDGNGRSARLLEKWFLQEKLGVQGTAIQLEKNYYRNLSNYYLNIKKIGLDYETLDYTKCLDFLLMTAKSIVP
jgi:Fic family protein